ncbi:MAG: hypothetical protein GDA49_06040 [Rhodospirillales bacterium]|nr:hypothetical protein [Rhodospirillales bacterium]
MADALQTVVAGLADSSKYRDLAPAALERTAQWALARHGKPSDALKAAKRKLHQAFGAYLEPGSLRNLDKLLDSMEAGSDMEETSRRALRLHRSSAERLERTEAFYAAIWGEIGLSSNVLDVAAGFNAFALPFMGLATDARYTALEIDRRMSDAIGRYLQLVDRPGEAIWTDVLTETLPSDVELALVLKTLPCLEQQEDGAALTLLQRLAGVPRIVVSYPVRSLGGRDKGMRETYGKHIESLARACGRELSFVPFDDELIAVLNPAES